MKAFIILMTLAASFSASAFSGTRTNICKYYYKHDIFSRDLILSVVKDNNKTYIWMDTPTPYGIRPYSYEVTKMSCGSDKSLNMQGNMNKNWQKVYFESREDNKEGQLEYFNENMQWIQTVKFECDAAAIESLCP